MDKRAAEVAQAEAALVQSGIEPLTAEFIGRFLGARVVVISAQLNGMSGTALVSGGEVGWLPQGNERRPITPELAFDIFMGRQLLRTYNA